MKLHNDEQVVNRIVDMKTRSGEYKEHPDAPGDASAMLFYCVVDIEKVEEDEYQETLHLSVSGEASGEQVRRRNKNHILNNSIMNVLKSKYRVLIRLIAFLMVNTFMNR